MIKKRIGSLVEPIRKKRIIRLAIRKKGLDQTADLTHCLAQLQNSGIQGLRGQHCTWGGVTWILGVVECGMASLHVLSFIPPFVTS